MLFNLHTDSVKNTENRHKPRKRDKDAHLEAALPKLVIIEIGDELQLNVTVMMTDWGASPTDTNQLKYRSNARLFTLWINNRSPGILIGWWWKAFHVVMMDEASMRNKAVLVTTGVGENRRDTHAHDICTASPLPLHL
jgi:hypothetical protein